MAAPARGAPLSSITIPLTIAVGCAIRVEIPIKINTMLRKNRF
jgi:hypothetical protein